MKQYFKDHPGADRKKHFVEKSDGENTSVQRGDVHTKVKPSKEIAQAIKSDWVGSKSDTHGNPVSGVLHMMERGQEVRHSYLTRAIGVLRNVEQGASKEDAAKYKALRKKLQDHARS